MALYARTIKALYIYWLVLSSCSYYGIIPTFQPEASFGKVYAAYGGVFIALSILWGWLVDGLRPDTYDIIGGLVCIVGVYIIMYAPR